VLILRKFSTHRAFPVGSFFFGDERVVESGILIRTRSTERARRPILTLTRSEDADAGTLTSMGEGFHAMCL
jgi:hypothetical protein